MQYYLPNVKLAISSAGIFAKLLIYFLISLFFYLLFRVVSSHTHIFDGREFTTKIASNLSKTARRRMSKMFGTFAPEMEKEVGIIVPIVVQFDIKAEYPNHFYPSRLDA